VDVGTTTKQLAALIGPATRTTGGRLTIEVDPGVAIQTSASAAAVRFAIGDRLLAATEIEGAELTCRCLTNPATGTPRVEITSDPRTALGAVKSLSPDALTLLLAVGIRRETDGHGIFIMFPG
jgi:hypothetical protein